SAHRAVVQDLHQIGLGITVWQIRFIENERTTEGVQRMEDGRGRRSAACKERFVAKRTNGKEAARLAGAVFAAQAQIGQFVEGIVYPSQKNIVCRDLLEQRGKINVAMEKGTDICKQLVLESKLDRL